MPGPQQRPSAFPSVTTAAACWTHEADGGRIGHQRLKALAWRLPWRLLVSLAHPICLALPQRGAWQARRRLEGAAHRAAIGGRNAHQRTHRDDRHASIQRGINGASMGRQCAVDDELMDIGYGSRRQVGSGGTTGRSGLN